MKNFQPPWRPGVCTNPGGAPKGKRISTWMMELGQMRPDEWAKLEPTLPANGLIALARIRRALAEEGDRAAEILLDRTEGSVTQVHEVHPGAGMSPEEIDAKWANRASRAAGLDAAGIPQALPAPEPPAAGAAGPESQTPS